MESIASSCCDQESTPRTPSAPLFEGSTDDCGTCVDVLFAQDVSRASQRGLSAHYGNSTSVLPVQPAGLVGTSDTEELGPILSFSIVIQANSRFSTVIRC